MGNVWNEAVRHVDASICLSAGRCPMFVSMAAVQATVDDVTVGMLEAELVRMAGEPA